LSRKIEFDTPNKWVNPLMGWTSTRDTAGQLREMMYFNSLEGAIAFAEREGFAYQVLPYHAKKIKPKAFADNFKW
jgi:NADH dehydrogenase (ubiquinone) Fe-S protein 4